MIVATQEYMTTLYPFLLTTRVSINFRIHSPLLQLVPLREWTVTDPFVIFETVAETEISYLTRLDSFKELFHFAL